VFFRWLGMNTRQMEVNQNGGFFVKGKGYDEAKYMEIVFIYYQEVVKNGSCTARELARAAKVAPATAEKAIGFLRNGEIVMKPTGRPEAGIGSGHGLTDEEHQYIYHLYLQNPSRPLDDYCLKFWLQTGKVVSPSFISRWVLCTANLP